MCLLSLVALLSFFFLSYAPPRVLHSFPTRRSSDLPVVRVRLPCVRRSRLSIRIDCVDLFRHPPHQQFASPERPDRDRKSTRLNSSHLGISYAVFCLKKKKKIKNMQNATHNTKYQKS